MNAFSTDMHIIFIEFILKTNEIEEIKYIIIRGNDGNFTSGNDLNNFSS
jgi:enoyl-CoA hydratase/carnithine racemase